MRDEDSDDGWRWPPRTADTMYAEALSSPRLGNEWRTMTTEDVRLQRRAHAWGAKGLGNSGPDVRARHGIRNLCPPPFFSCGVLRSRCTVGHFGDSRPMSRVGRVTPLAKSCRLAPMMWPPWCSDGTRTGGSRSRGVATTQRPLGRGLGASALAWGGFFTVRAPQAVKTRY